LVALLKRDDAEHKPVVAALKQIKDPLLSVWPVIVEAMYLLGTWPSQESLWDLLATGDLPLLPLDEEDFQGMKVLMEKYRDLPMDLADAALVHVAQREGIHKVLTLDHRHFKVYRLKNKRALTLLP
jgi:predicted nucleic acid-binding protein